MIEVGTKIRLANGRGGVVENIEPRFYETVRLPDGTSEDRRVLYAYVRIVGLSALYPFPLRFLEEGVADGKYKIVE